MTRNACSIALRNFCSEAGRAGCRLRLCALFLASILLPVVYDASDASVVGSSLRVGVSPPDAFASVAGLM